MLRDPRRESNRQDEIVVSPLTPRTKRLVRRLGHFDLGVLQFFDQRCRERQRLGHGQPAPLQQDLHRRDEALLRHLLFSDPNPAVIEITIRQGTPLFFPIVNSECSVFEGDGNNEAKLRACANGHVDHTSGRFAIIDGQPVEGLNNFRADSPLFNWGPLPEGNIFEYVGFDAPAGTTSPSVADGYWLLLHPFSVGRHVIEFGGTFDETGDVINTRYIITVSP
jgi:hypothetical protein